MKDLDKQKQRKAIAHFQAIAKQERANLNAFYGKYSLKERIKMLEGLLRFPLNAKVKGLHVKRI